MSEVRFEWSYPASEDECVHVCGELEVDGHPFTLCGRPAGELGGDEHVAICELAEYGMCPHCRAIVIERQRREHLDCEGCAQCRRGHHCHLTGVRDQCTAGVRLLDRGGG